ncbi:MAG: hypothetical protein V7L05_16030, partial [Nostoc sp.]
MDSLLLERPNQTSSGYKKPLDINLDFLAGSYKSKTLLANLEVIDEDIIANLDKVLEIKPDLHEAWYNRSIALVNLGSLVHVTVKKGRKLCGNHEVTWSHILGVLFQA